MIAITWITGTCYWCGESFRVKLNGNHLICPLCAAKQYLERAAARSRAGEGDGE